MNGRTNRSAKRDNIFFEALKANGIVGEAARIAGYSRTSVYEYKAADPVFAARMAEAIEYSTERLEVAMMHRAIDGAESYVTSQGKIVYIEVEEEVIDPFTKKPMKDEEGNIIKRTVKKPLVERKYSDTLAIFLAKARRPEIYRERYEARVNVNLDKAPQDLTDEELEALIRDRSNGDQSS